PCHQLMGSNLYYCQQPGLFSGNQGNALANKTIRYTPLLVLEASFADKEVHLVINLTHHPPLPLTFCFIFSY
ncbi:hypothetical protein ACQP3C_29690, partial [Escherichia coli]